MLYNVVVIKFYEKDNDRKLSFNSLVESMEYITTSINLLDDGHYAIFLNEVNSNEINTLFTLNPFVKIHFGKKKDHYFNVSFIIDNDTNFFYTDEGDTISFADLYINPDNVTKRINKDIISSEFYDEIDKMFNFFIKQLGAKDEIHSK